MTLFSRLLLAAFVVAGITAGIGTATSSVAAKGAATPSPSPTPEATPTPEPVSVAIPRLEAKLKTSPNDRDALQELASDYLQVNRADLAQAATTRLITQLGVKTAQVYYLSGYSNLTLGRVAQAVTDLEQASNLEPTNLSVLTTLTDVYTRTNRLADAERVAKRAVTFNKTDKRAYENYGQVLETEQKWDDARAQYELAAGIDPKDVAPVIFEARTYLSQNAIALASSLYDRALAIDPNSLDALAGKARILAQQHQVKDAIPMYEKLRGLVPDADQKASILDEEARLYAVEKMDTDADATFKSAIAQYPNSTGTHVAYGDYLASKNNSSAAEAEWTLGLGPNKDNRDALARLGSYYADNKQPQKAIDNLKRLADITPNEPKVYAALGQLYAGQRDWQHTHDAFRHAYDLTHAPDALTAVGEADLNMHNYKEALTIFEALDKNAQDYVRQDPRVLYLLGQAYEKTNDKPKARLTYARLLTSLKPGTQAYSQVKGLIDSIDRSSKATASSKGTPSPKPTPAKH